MFSAGLLESIACVLQIKGNFIHKNLNLINPNMTDMPLVKDETEDYSIKYALNNSFGFGGINTSVVIKNVNL
jgi:malonyl-ACP decarboxylase